MSYHFSNNAELVLAATRPVMAEAISKLFAVLDERTSLETQLRDILGLFIDFARVNGALLDIFIEAIAQDEAGQALVQQCLARLNGFFEEAVDAQLFSTDSNPRFLLLALWGMCKLVAELPSLPYAIFDPGLSLDEQRRAEVELILKLMLHGVSASKTPLKRGVIKGAD